ncbi:hypothetical protein VB774_17185 [Pseudanabaena galeata UHCC 0370]|jgi:hypothetical protein|uniref:Uncharacterized protein n=1 Tax=Pseudanabaena galeata UHCC 0370 TaxID=3110310 RepID=A0ABU5TMG9_9CYAN|nr:MULTISPECIES: hypothetical protein [Pseudanabaena]MEA5479359.1 hypothetical protein [Pseudanabaena galeata UHCC 0370]MEA5487071.1 hypothetical protein [Pseudanabaena sp. CCNP1317]WGS74235.1 hypothetical protein OA858_09480 [Pseudanabaena galeata CCNP1313]
MQVFTVVAIALDISYGLDIIGDRSLNISAITTQTNHKKYF